MTARAERDHQVENSSIRNRSWTFVEPYPDPKPCNRAASLVVKLQNGSRMTAEVFLIVPLARKAG
jgi:hypothetical protein